jgi:hypothetical protein
LIGASGTSGPHAGTNGVVRFPTGSALWFELVFVLRLSKVHDGRWSGDACTHARICALKPLVSRLVRELDGLVIWYLCLIEISVAVEMDK